MKIGEYVDKMSPLWVEGQLVQLNRRPGAATAYLTLQDTDVDMSLSVAAPVTTLDAMGPAVRDGARVVVHAKPVFWTRRGTLHLDARQVRPVGEGELLVRLEHLKRVLAAEGLFDAERKRSLPFLPRRVGLICGHGSAAERDVVENARRRWPSTVFAMRQVPVQGPDAVSAVCAAVTSLDAEPEVDVIVIARGGGSFLDLLPFSNEALVRLVSATRTPVVSAIGHEIDQPLLDLVADVRASTPTDAAKRIVPDLAVEQASLVGLTDRARRAVTTRLAHERRHLDAIRARPVLAEPLATLTPHRKVVEDARARGRRAVEHRLARAYDELTHLARQVRLLSPQSTLERGYALVQDPHGHVIRHARDVHPDDTLTVRVADGRFRVHVAS